jgi:hypothetical protein
VVDQLDFMDVSTPGNSSSSSVGGSTSGGAVSVVFGCEQRETGAIFDQNADGLMGLGGSSISVVTQVGCRQFNAPCLLAHSSCLGTSASLFSLCLGGARKERGAG